MELELVQSILSWIRMRQKQVEIIYIWIWKTWKNQSIENKVKIN
jgi:hypothetical protein